MDEFNAEELLRRVKAEIMANDLDATEEQADKTARQFIENIVKAAASGDGGVIGIGGNVFTYNGNGVTSVSPETPEDVDVVGETFAYCGNSETPAAPPADDIDFGSRAELSPEAQEKLEKVFAKVDELIPPVETVRLKLSRAETTVFDSKMGGVPYIPKGMEYPTVREGEHAGKPLYFLAQLNFGKLPKLAGFPTEGILQFFAGFDHDEDYSVGMNYNEPCDQNAFRVIYHENVINDVNVLFGAEDMPEFEELDPYSPVKGELLLIADKPETVPVTSSDIRFEGAFVKAYNEVSGTSLESIWGKGGLFEADEDFCHAAFDARNLQGTRIGGFPFFMQGDPRGNYPDHTVLLFQSDSEWDGEDYCVSWGDSGVANFFITPEDLARRDFSKVLYNWDCG